MHPSACITRVEDDISFHCAYATFECAANKYRCRARCDLLGNSLENCNMADNPSLQQLVNRVWAAIHQVNEHIDLSEYSRTTWYSENATKPLPVFGWTQGEEHFEQLGLVKLWNEYFEWVLGEWDNDEDGERMSEAKLNFIVDRLTSAATQLDEYGPQLVRRYRSISQVPEDRIQGILLRRVVLNGFLNSVEIGLEHWYRSAGTSLTLL